MGKLFRSLHDRSDEPDRHPEPLYHLSHPRPRTRRQFLGQGFLTGAAMVMSPSLFGLLGRGGNAAWAQDCGLTAGGNGLVPFICVDLAGGANMVGSNVLAGGPGGFSELLTLAGYEKQGLPAALTPLVDPAQINTTFGLPFHADSPFLLGMLDKTTLNGLAQTQTNGILFCARSANDTQNNPHNPMYGIAAAGADGGLLTLIGNEPTDSGGNSVNPMSWFDASIRPTKIDRPQDNVGLVDTGRLVEFMDTEGADAVMAAVERLSNAKVDKMEITHEMIVTDLVRCAYQQSSDLVSIYSDPSSLDPRQDPVIATGPAPIFDAGELGQGKFQRTSAVMKLVVDGHAGAGTLEFGGYDYHNGTRATGEQRDFEAGQAMGACLEYAAQTGKDLCLYVFSDGSLDSNGQIDGSAAGKDKGIWQGDNSSTAASFMLVYSPTARPTLNDPAKQQIGHFRPDGSVETGATEISNNPESLAEAVVANYLALHGRADELDAVLPGHRIGSAAPVTDLIAFDSIRG